MTDDKLPELTLADSVLYYQKIDTLISKHNESYRHLRASFHAMLDAPEGSDQKPLKAAFEKAFDAAITTLGIETPGDRDKFLTVFAEKQILSILCGNSDLCKKIPKMSDDEAKTLDPDELDKPNNLRDSLFARNAAFVKLLNHEEEKLKAKLESMIKVPLKGPEMKISPNQPYPDDLRNLIVIREFEGAVAVHHIVIPTEKTPLTAQEEEARERADKEVLAKLEAKDNPSLRAKHWEIRKTDPFHPVTRDKYRKLWDEFESEFKKVSNEIGIADPETVGRLRREWIKHRNLEYKKEAQLTDKEKAALETIVRTEANARLTALFKEARASAEAKDKVRFEKAADAFDVHFEKEAKKAGIHDSRRIETMRFEWEVQQLKKEAEKEGHSHYSPNHPLKSVNGVLDNLLLSSMVHVDDEGSGQLGRPASPKEPKLPSTGRTTVA